jgi:hypothetical protein
VKLTGEATIFGKIDLTAWAQKTAAVPPGKAANGSATAPTIPPSPPRRSNKLLADRLRVLGPDDPNTLTARANLATGEVGST